MPQRSALTNNLGRRKGGKSYYDPVASRTPDEVQKTGIGTWNSDRSTIGGTNLTWTHQDAHRIQVR